MISIAAVLLLLGSCATVLSHEPLTNGTSTGPAYAVYTDALNIPTNKVSLSGKRYSSANGPVFWLKYNATAGDNLYLAAGSGVAVPNRALRVKAYIFGPKLARRYSRRSFKVDVPAGPGFKFQFVQSPASLSSCKWLTSDYAKGSNNVTTYSGITRCGSYNPATGKGNFPMLDYVFVAPADGVYYFALHLTKFVNAAWFVTTGVVGHAHAENLVLPTPPAGNAAQIDTSSPNLTVTNAVFGLKKISLFNIR